MITKQALARQNSFIVDTFEERHFTLAEIATMWRISREKARRTRRHPLPRTRKQHSRIQHLSHT